MNNPEQNPTYKQVLEYSGKYHPDPIGFTDYSGPSSSDKLYPKQNNIQIALLVRICEKLDYLEIRIRVLEDKIRFDKDLEKNTEKSQISVDKGKEKPNYKFPYKNEKKIVFWSQ